MSEKRRKQKFQRTPFEYTEKGELGEKEELVGGRSCGGRERTPPYDDPTVCN